MKKVLPLTFAFVVSLTLLSTALAVTEGDYTWEGHTVTIAAIDLEPTFIPEKMTDDQYVVAINLDVPASVLADDTLRRPLFGQVKLVDENGAIYSLDTAITYATGHTLFFVLDKGTNLDSMSLQFIATTDMPEEYVGQWAGSVGDITLSFDVGADGTGTYLFEQAGYHERYDFTLAVESETFSVQIAKDNQLGIVSCYGTYAYADGVLTLDVRTVFANGRVFTYAVPCERVE